MKRLHSAPLVTVLLALIAGTSGANVKQAVVEQKPKPRLEQPIDSAALPEQCRQFLDVPADSTSERLPWQQKLSLAECREEVSVAPVTEPQKLGAMIATLERAMAPSEAIYRDALAKAPSEIRIRAAFGLGMTYVNIIVRARIAIGADAAFGGATYGAAYDRSQKLHLALEPLLASDRAAALVAFDEVARLAAADPVAARANDVILDVVARARSEAQDLR